MRLNEGLKIGDAKKEIAAHLESFGIEPDEAGVESSLILEHATGMNVSRQLVCADVALTREQTDKAERLLARRHDRIPIQYCLGKAEFFGLTFVVRPGVFIPRVDTEAVAQKVLDLSERFPADSKIKVLEIGCGSGCISITLAARDDRMLITATDISQEARSITAENAAVHKVSDRLTLSDEGLWWTLPGKYDIIVCNPPYIPVSQKPSLQPEVRDHEPHEALFGQDDDGLRFFRKLSTTCGDMLEGADSFLAVEVGDGQALLVSEIMRSAGWRKVSLEKDLNGNPRVVTAFSPL